MAPPPSTTSEDGTVSVSMASRLVQYRPSSSASPGMGGDPRLGPRRDDDGPARLVDLVTDHDAARAVEPAPAAYEAPALGDEAVHRHRVVPVVGGLGADALGHRRPIGIDGRRPGHARHASRLGQQVGGPDHHLGRDAAPVGTLPAEESPRCRRPTRPGQSSGHLLAAGAHPEDHHVHLFGHVASRRSRRAGCRAHVSEATATPGRPAAVTGKSGAREVRRREVRRRWAPWRVPGRPSS